MSQSSKEQDKIARDKAKAAAAAKKAKQESAEKANASETKKLTNLSKESTDKNGGKTDVYVERVAVNVFFDGTNNNYYNVTSAKKLGNQTSSYYNGLTNVARMWLSISRDRSRIPVYIDGVGTTRFLEDSSDGLAFGQGNTGVILRAESAFESIEKEAYKVIGDAIPQHLYLNIYGFSRGSAAARYFIHLLNTKPAFPTWKLGKNQIVVNFVGLFDTVVSVSKNEILKLKPFGFQERNPKVPQDFYEGYAVKVFHLAAGDEFRANFSSTNINSAKKPCKGYELTIPGAHSDVGGSYPEEGSESLEIPSNHGEFLQFVTKKGWYRIEDKTPNTSDYKRTFTCNALNSAISGN